MTLITISAAARSAMCNTLVDLLDVGAGGAGIMRFYTTAQPAGPGTAISGQTLLVTVTFSATAFGAASSGVATAAAITNGTIVATGTAAWSRWLDKDVTAVIDTSVGTATSQIIFNTVAFVTDDEVAITSLTVTMPASNA